MLLLLKWNSLARVSRNVAYGLYELLKTSAANIHSDADWSVVFTLLECVGAGAPPPRVLGDNVISEYGRSSGTYRNCVRKSSSRVLSFSFSGEFNMQDRDGNKS